MQRDSGDATVPQIEHRGVAPDVDARFAGRRAQGASLGDDRAAPANRIERNTDSNEAEPVFAHPRFRGDATGGNAGTRLDATTSAVAAPGLFEPAPGKQERKNDELGGAH